MTAYDGSPSLTHVLATDELSHRPVREPDYHTENEAIKALVQRLANRPEHVVPYVTSTALDLCRAGSVGISVLEREPSGERVFRWTEIAGQLAPHVGGCTPVAFSPCGVTLERGCPQLFRHPERYFTYYKSAVPAIVEGLVVPISGDGEPLGTIWIVSHAEERVFDREDARIMESLAVVTATAIRAARFQRKAESATRLKDLVLEAARLATWSWDVDADDVSWDVQSDSAAPGFRGSRADFLGLLDPRDRPNAAEALAAATAGEAEISLECRLADESNPTRHILIKGRVVEGPRRIVGGVVLDITARRQAEQTRNEWLRQLISAQEEERRRVARDLHDLLGRHAAGLAFGLHALDLDGVHRSAIDALRRLVADFDLDIRRVVRELRPAVLIDLGLTLAVSAYVDDRSRQSDIAADFSSHGDDALPASVQTTIYRIVQEALTNVGRHARARRVSVVLQRRTHDFMAIVEDDGIGFDPAARAQAGDGRLGVIGMGERAALIGGRCTIASKPGAGTTVLVSVPFDLPKTSEPPNERGAG